MYKHKSIFGIACKFFLTALLASAVMAFSACRSEVPVEDESSIGLASIQITKPADKIIYKKGDTLDTKGLEITATYRNGATKVVSGWTVSGFDSSQDVGSQNVIVMYAEGETSRFTEYNIQYANLSGISISHPAKKTIYSKGDELDTTDLEITANYKNGMSQVVSGWTVSGFDSSADVTSQTLTVTYGEGESSYSVQYSIQYADLTGISVTTMPRKTKYRVGDYAAIDDYKNRDFINLADLVLTVSKSDGSSERIDFNSVQSDVLVRDSNGSVMVEFLNDAMTGPCTNYYDIPRTKAIDLGGGKSIVMSGFAFIKEDANPQVIIEYTEDVGGTKYSRFGSLTLAVNYEPPYKFTDGPVAVSGADGHYYLGDYPQSAKADDVIVCKKSMDRGYFKYYAGSDGNYYVKLESDGEYYFKVEPIEWYKKNVETVTGNHYLPVKAIDGGIPFKPGTDWNSSTGYFDCIQKNHEYTDGKKTNYHSYTDKYYFLAGTYKKSHIGDFLNGTSEYGSGLFNGRGFYQTAFSNEAASYVIGTEVYETFYYSRMDVYTDVTNAGNNYWEYFEDWAPEPITYIQNVALADTLLCSGDSAWALTDYAKKKELANKYMVNNTEDVQYPRAMMIKNRYNDGATSSETTRGWNVFYLDENMTLQHTEVSADNLCVIPTIRIRGK